MTLASLVDRMVGQPASHERKHAYKFGRTLGAGAFGVVREAVNKETGEHVAVKVLLRSKIRTPQDQQAVQQEFTILRQLHHPNIVAFREWFESKEKFYMVTQLCTGGELFDRICDYGSFTERDAARLTREVAGAVQHMHHRNIVHRDIKPENLLYEYHDENGQAPLVLCDFGVAKSLLSSEELISSAAGSLGYAAPEIFLNRGHSKPCDVWSLGVVLYTTLCGYSPFQAESPEGFMKEVQPDYEPSFPPSYWGKVSTEAKDLIWRMLRYDPDERLTIDEVFQHPWVAGVDVAEYSTFDLLPSVKPHLAARRRWRAAFERVLLLRMLQRLDMENEGEDEDSAHAGSAPSHSSASHNEAGSRFMQVVAAASAQAKADDAARQEKSSFSSSSS